jgi:hypothetical protein
MAAERIEVSVEDAADAATSVVAQRLADAEHEIYRDAAAAYAGFARVCRAEMELEPQVVLRAHLHPLVDVAEFGQLTAPNAARDAVDRWTNAFRRGWLAHISDVAC